ncbi:AAC(3) family N-acetyltransferase, partial [Campylobacter volucris]|uniref:AAC(3) family N-acetyltransferase n=1 Tax=Campylobacter volucris TaxID=1031542 RepID=UPI00189D58FE
AIGKEGTLIMPTFTYSFCKNGIYDKLNSKSEVGILTEYFRKCEGVKRTNDPIFSFAIKGSKQDLFLKDTKSCFGENCVYDILTKENGKIILFGMDNSGYTIVHFLEELIQVPYRYFKNFNGILIDENGKKRNIDIDYYVRDLDKNLNLSAEKQINLLKIDNNFNQLIFSKSYIISIDTKKYLNTMLKHFKQDYYCLIE